MDPSLAADIAKLPNPRARKGSFDPDEAAHALYMIGVSSSGRTWLEANFDHVQLYLDRDEWRIRASIADRLRQLSRSLRPKTPRQELLWLAHVEQAKPTDLVRFGPQCVRPLWRKATETLHADGDASGDALIQAEHIRGVSAGSVQAKYGACCKALELVLTQYVTGYDRADLNLIAHAPDISEGTFESKVFKYNRDTGDYLGIERVDRTPHEGVSCKELRRLAEQRLAELG